MEHQHGFIVEPPGTTEPSAQSQQLLDACPGTNSWDRCSWFAARSSQEWSIVNLTAGSRVRFKAREWDTWRSGTVKVVYFYDGWCIRVTEDDPDELISHTLFTDFGDEVVKL